MADVNVKQNEDMGIDLKRPIDAVINKLWLVVLISVLCAAIAFAGTLFFITPQYQSSAMFYVNNSAISVGGTTLTLTANDISASRGLVNTYIVILNTRSTLQDIIDYSGVNVTYGQLQGMISAEAVDKTEVFRVTVTHPDPESAEKLANSAAYILPKRISSIVEGSSAQVVDTAVIPSSPSSPNYVQNALIGFAIGMLAVVGVIVLRDMVDVSVRTEEDINRVCNYPVLASVPDMLLSSKGGYEYGYGSKYGKYNKYSKYQNAGAAQQATTLFGNGINFAASEAYKLLRTKLQYSFADENNSRVICVSSALSGEGKSLTSVNLAHSLAQLDKRVLLIDCDMRRPSLHTKLSIEKRAGLSEYLTGQIDFNELIQPWKTKEEDGNYQIITAGQIPTNPIELLSSERMKKLLEMLRKQFDYVIIDLPPVGEVSDALAITQQSDGVLLVVRKDHADRISVANAVQQFEFVEGRILGVVYNCAHDEATGYGRSYYRRYYRRYYSKYYRRSHYHYAGVYAANSAANKDTKTEETKSKE